MSSNADTAPPTRRRVLIVDDSKFHRVLIAELLQGDGYDFLFADEGMQAIATAREHQPKLILLDMSLPGIDGLDVLKRLKSCTSTQDIPVILVTGSHDEKLITRAFEAGAVDYIAKPISAPLAMARVRMAIRGQEIVDALQGTNERLLAAQRDALAANQAKSVFLANMSHEIRTPLTAILGFTDLLLEDGDIRRAPPERLADLRTIKRNGEHLLDLINDILDLSKIEAGRLEIERIPSSLLQILRDVTNIMRGRAQAKGIELEVRYLGPIPRTVTIDPTRVRQLLVNLVGNAVKFTEKGHVSVTCRVRAISPGEFCAQLDVIDTGIGMTAAQLEKLFQPFSQADVSTTRKFGGTGLGLTICRRLCDLMAGSIRVQSEAGKGSVFSVQFPVGSSDEVDWTEPGTDQDAEEKREEIDGGGCPEGIGGRILLVEDSQDNQRLISFNLKRAGADVEIAANGRIGVERALEGSRAGNPFDVILMDIQMPEMDGFTATRLLREHGYEGAIIALTANAMSGDREKCLLAGCDDYAPKPIDRAKLLRQISTYLVPAISTSHADSYSR